MSIYDYGKSNLDINEEDYGDKEYIVYQDFIEFAQELNRIYQKYPKSVGIVRNIRVS